MIPRALLSFGLAALVGITSLSFTSSEASAGWRRGGHFRHHIVHRPHFVHRTHFVHRRVFVRPVVHRRHFVVPVAFASECIIKRKVRWTRWGYPVRIIKKVCF
jgi:hypothetical protein